MKIPLHLPAPVRRWQLAADVAAADPLVLARMLQKIAVPEIELTSASYSRAAGRIEVTLTCTAARAELTRQKIERLLAVQRARVQPFEA